MLLVMLFFLAFARGRSDRMQPSSFGPGPYEVGKFDVGTKKRPLLDGKWHLSVTFPTTPASTQVFPILLFVTGLAGQNAVSAYSTVLNHTASHGVVVVGVDQKNTATINYTNFAMTLEGVLEFVGNGSLAEQLVENNVSGIANTSRIVFGGHSAGNHILVRHLTSFGCGSDSGNMDAAGMVMIDPVDGADPFGIQNRFVIHPPALVNFIMPALHIRTGLDPKAAMPGMPACAPKKISNARFYNAWRGPIWQMNAVDMGHMDVQNEGGAGSMGRVICAHNPKATAREQYRMTVAGATAAFVRGLMLDDLTSAVKMFDGQEPALVNVTYKSDLRELTPAQIRPECLRVS